MASGVTRGRHQYGILEHYDSISHETVFHGGAHVFYEDFLGKAFNVTNTWTAIDVSVGGDSTPVLVADSGNGVISLPTDATVEAQQTGLYWGDQRTLVLDQGLQFEAVLALHVLPTVAQIVVFGLAADYNAVANTVTESIWFRLDAATGGLITVETDDTTGGTETSKVTTGVTVVADAYHVFRIDCTTLSDVHFYIDGQRVASTTTFDVDKVPALKLQPYFHISKLAGSAGLGTIYLDAVRCWSKRSST